MPRLWLLCIYFITYDLICDLYTKVEINEDGEQTKLGYKIEGVSELYVLSKS